MLAQTDLRQHCIDYFPTKQCMCALGQHCIQVIFLSAVLSQTYLDNTAQEKILCDVVILLRQHCTAKNQIPQCFVKEARQTTLHRKNPVQSCLDNVWSLFRDFYFGVVNFLITGCCKYSTNIVKI